MKTILRSIVPSAFWNALSNAKKYVEQYPFRYAEKRGWNITRKSDFYSPLPNLDDLRKNEKRWNKPSTLAGVKIDLAELKNFWAELSQKYSKEYELLPSYDEVKKLGFGVGYTKVDARTSYYMLRHIKPKKYIEVGSGISTHYCTLAVEENKKTGHDTAIQCIEPYPYDKLYSINNIKVIKDEVQNVDLSVFQQLEENDVLFIDSSHAGKIDSDVNYEILDILPNLKKGVYVHIHDIPFPFNFPYPANLYIYNREWPQYWNEPAMVQAFLAFNDTFKIIQSTSYIRFHDEQFIKDTIPEYSSEVSFANGLGSLWLQKVK